MYKTLEILCLVIGAVAGFLLFCHKFPVAGEAAWKVAGWVWKYIGEPLLPFALFVGFWLLSKLMRHLGRSK